MRLYASVRFYLIGIIAGFIGILLMGSLLPIHAQGSGFATNTPAPSDNNAEDTTQENMDTSSQFAFATNTPVGIAPSPTPVYGAPQLPPFNYGSRFWLEADFVQLVSEQIALMDDGNEDVQLAVNVLLYEMERRFPFAPNDPALRRELVQSAINAPVGSLDLRSLVHPFVQNAIDSDPSANTIERDGFTITLTASNLDGRGSQDRVVNIQYEQEGAVRYDEYLLAIANERNSFTLIPTNYDLPPAPFGMVNQVTLAELRDVNADSLDELVLRVDDGQTSDRYYIIQHRNGRAVDLIDPTSELRIGDIISWPIDSASTTAPDLVVFQYDAVSRYPDWDCRTQIEYTWQYERNLYRRSQDLNASPSSVDSLGCRLRDADLFANPPAESIAIIENALIDYGFNEPSSTRALMTLAMLYALEGRVEDARNTAQSIITADDDTTWESQQARALIRGISIAGNTALDICEGVAIASEAPACDMSAVIGRFLDVVSLSVEQDLEDQLNNIGLSVAESLRITEIGRAPRTVVTFDYFDSGWWGFVEDRDGFYRVEPAEAPTEFAESIFPQALIPLPQNAFNALLENDFARVLAILNSTIRDNPDTPLAPSALYVQALAYEFTGDRERARTTYYAIWEQHTFSIWGRIASAHLELR
ncbi:MAG: tetratricopeptide repeat protein [Anaerolineae bacterium]